MVEDIVNQMLLGNFSDAVAMTERGVKSKPRSMARRMALVALALPEDMAYRYINLFVD